MKATGGVMKFTIEHRVPLAPRRGCLGYAAVLRKLGVGDSVLIPDRLPTHIHNAVAMLGIAPSGCFACRSVDGGVRVWRIK